ncbi:hypothetical protein OUZ56_000004 [Daphnia magna]|uniref:Uncharacterized protein n=1 Tax=Daphnia magna TaxID=35525 RepID=A0ABQ9ZYF4_9CRUS|nr:hypothetical protein OUZ56_000004 [Daphnia magna]
MDIAVQRVPGKRAGSFVYVTEDNYIFHLYKERSQANFSLNSFAMSQTQALCVPGSPDHVRHANEENEIARIAVENSASNFSPAKTL